jgi:hypothetical protein
VAIIVFIFYWLAACGFFYVRLLWIEEMVAVIFMLTVGIVISIATFLLLQKHRRNNAKILLFTTIFTHIFGTFFPSFPI